MPSNNQDRTLEATKRVMPELIKLVRYEKRRRSARPGDPPDCQVEMISVASG